MNYEEHGNNTGPLSGWESAQQVPVTPQKKGWTGSKVIALTLCCSLLAGILGAGGAILYGEYRDFRDEMAEEVTEVTESTNITALFEGQREENKLEIYHMDTNKLMTPAEVYAANVNSTVGITTSITTNFWGYQTTSAASGSGFIISRDGYIVTNYHVIENSNAITVSCYNGTSYEADLVGYDERNDIAVLKVDAEDLVPVILGNSDQMNVGDSVVAIGNPLGELTFSLTSGTVSALDRQVTMSNGVTMDLVQTDCAINSGNSGGALFNLYGEVIGITNAKYSSSSYNEASIDNIGFAIPVNDVQSIVKSIIEKGYVSKPYIGVSVTDISVESQSYGLPQGAAVQYVADGSPAAAAGLQKADIITSINTVSVTGSNDLVEQIEKSDIGDELTLTVYRQGNILELRITVGEQIQGAKNETPSNNSQPNTALPQYPWGWQ